MAAGKCWTGWVTSGCMLRKDSVHAEYLQRLLSFLDARGKDRLFDVWEDEFLSHSGRFPGLEDRNSWYECPEFADMILIGGHLFCLQKWHLLLRSGSLVHLPRGRPELCCEVVDPGLLWNLAIIVTIWGSALKHEGGLGHFLPLETQGG